VRASIGDAQAKIIARCLENDPARRYQSAAEVKLELEQLLRDAGIDEPVRELAAFVRAPEAHAANVRARLVSRAASPPERSTSPTSGPAPRWRRSGGPSRSSRKMRRPGAGWIGSAGAIGLLKLARGTIIGLVSVAVLIAAGWELYRARSASTRGRRWSAPLRRSSPWSRAHAKRRQRNRARSP